MASIGDLLFHNWHLKLFSLLMATMLWATIANQSISEIGVAVPLEYQNVPERTEVTGDATNTVEVRLRGPAALLREISPEDVSSVIDMTDIAVGDSKIVALTAEHIRAPFGIEVVRVIPARVRVSLEPTESRDVRIAPRIEGTPAIGFEIKEIRITPPTVGVEGPASHVRDLDTVATTPVVVDGRRDGVEQLVDVDIEDPLVRIPQNARVRVEVRIGPED